MTGIVAAAVGKLINSGDFEVEDICYLGMPEQPPHPAPNTSSPAYLLLVSGLDLGSTYGDVRSSAMQSQLLVSVNFILMQYRLQ